MPFQMYYLFARENIFLQFFVILCHVSLQIHDLYDFYNFYLNNSPLRTLSDADEISKNFYVLLRNCFILA